MNSRCAWWWLWDHLPVVSTRARRDNLRWQKDTALLVMQRVLDDLETRGDEVAARSRLYVVLTEIDWT